MCKGSVLIIVNCRLYCQTNRPLETLEILLEKKLLYVSSVDTVDVSFERNQIPSLSQYWARRDRTAGVHPVIATIP